MKTPSALLAILTVGGILFASSAKAAEKPAQLLPLYEKVSTALAADDLTSAHSAACALAVEATHLQKDGVCQEATAVGKASDLPGARQAFRTLSKDIIPIARHQKGWFIMNCPMAKANWVQSTRNVANPYLGKMMPSCGTVTEETKG